MFNAALMTTNIITICLLSRLLVFGCPKVYETDSVPIGVLTQELLRKPRITSQVVCKNCMIEIMYGKKIPHYKNE